MIIKSNIQEMTDNNPDGYNPKFNCWGATQYALGERKKYAWITERVMCQWICEKTVKVEKNSLKIGDILVISCNEYNKLIHTAVYIGNGKWFHKQGKFETSIMTKEEIIKIYTNLRFFWDGTTPKIDIHRLNNNN